MELPYQEGPVEQVSSAAEGTAARAEGRLQATVRVYREIVIRDGEFVPRREEASAERAAAC